jgi:hypothetical protein
MPEGIHLLGAYAVRCRDQQVHTGYSAVLNAYLGIDVGSVVLNASQCNDRAVFRARRT